MYEVNHSRVLEISTENLWVLDIDKDIDTTINIFFGSDIKINI